MTFSDDLKKFSVHAEFATKQVFVNSASACHSSVTNGDPRTGAPGQPVDTGNLKASWQLNFASDTLAEITTNTIYAPAIEDGVGPHGPLTLRSEVGGFHSVALTVANFDKLVESETRKVAR